MLQVAAVNLQRLNKYSVHAMFILNMTRSKRIFAAYVIAIMVDIIQFPEFLGVFATTGAAETIVIATDALAAVAIMNLIGWHWMFLPSIAAELVPGLNLVPTWTFAVYAVTRNKNQLPE